MAGVEVERKVLGSNDFPVLDESFIAIWRKKGDGSSEDRHLVTN